MQGDQYDATARWVAAEGAMPALCELAATLSPTEGSRTGVVYRFPEG